MAEQAEQIIIDVQIDTGKTAAELASVNASLENLKKQQKALRDEIKAGNDEWGENSAELAKVEQQIKLLTSSQKALSGQLQTTEQNSTALGDSFREMDARARALENQYKSLTKAQRESAEGQQLKQALIEQKKALQEFDAELGNHQRNVGNYPKVITAMSPTFAKLNSLVGSVGVSMDDLQKNGMAAFKGLGASVKAFGKAFITPPIAIITVVLSAIIFAMNQLRDAFKRNDDASTQLEAAMAKLQPIGDAIAIVFNKLADVIAGLVDKMMSAYEWIIKLANKVGLISDEFVQATENASALVRSIDQLQQMEREYTVNSAKRSKEVARLRNEAMDTEDLQVRIAKLKEAIALEEQTMLEAQKIAEKRYNNLVAEARKTGDTSDETTDKIAKAEAAMYQAQEAYYNGTRRLLKELASTQKEYREQLLDREELDHFIAATLDKFMNAKKQFNELTKPEPLDEEEEEEFLQPLTAYQQKIADLMREGSSFADAQKKIAAETRAAWAGAGAGIAGSMAQAFGTMSSLLKEYQDENEDAVKAAKGFALAGILASEAESIANGVKAVTAAIAGATNAGAATGIAAPLTTPVFIAEMVGAVTGVLATTMANIVQAKNILSGGMFATGGIVGGTSYTGDRVHAMVNSGEMILNKQPQSRLFEIANTQTDGGYYESMRAAMADALQAMPAPVMVYSEFEQFGKRVATYKEIARI